MKLCRNCLEIWFHHVISCGIHDGRGVTVVVVVACRVSTNFLLFPNFRPLFSVDFLAYNLKQTFTFIFYSHRQCGKS